MAVKSNEGYWNATCSADGFPSLSGEVNVDVAVVGGGIVGTTTARALKDRGMTVAVVEARKVGRQVTGRSTAKVTSQHKIIYRTLRKKFGEEKARLYAEAQEAGIRKIAEYASTYGIDCDLEPMAAYTYTCDPSNVGQIEEEAEVARAMGLPASVVRETDLPFEIEAALRFDDQYQFHPTKYVAGLARTIPGEGCHVFEDSRVTDWSASHVSTEGGTVRARHVVMATHLPLGGIGGFFAQAHPYAEPVVAARVGRVPNGMFINIETPSHSIRTHKGADGQVYAIAAGTSFKPGHPDDERRHFKEIEDWLVQFDAGPIEHRWVNEDYGSVDNAPFVGWSSSTAGAYLVATGFDAWGISNGTAAGLILADLAAGNGHPWLGIFDARRIKPVAGGPSFVKENLEVAAHLVSGYLSRKLRSYDELRPGDAAIMKIDGKNVAAYRDEQGQVHAVSAVCSHMGCMLGWNGTDRTWDCPCHGSRFALDGSVVHGPAATPLQRHTT